MSSTCSPCGDAGGTLHLLSPTQIHYGDRASPFNIRRSLSRSPSKSPAFRLVTSTSTSPSPTSPLSPSCASAQHRSASAGLLSLASMATPSSTTVPDSTPVRPRSVVRKLSPMRSSNRSGNGHRSPGKRTLSECSDNGNATPQSSAGSSSDDIENRVGGTSGDERDRTTAAPVKSAWLGDSDSTFAPHRALSRNSGLGAYPAKSSPLKRSDGVMNLDHTGFGNPSAKRRSLHSASFGADFDIFDHEAAYQNADESRRSEDRSSTDSSASPEQTSLFSPLPRRSSSLRRTTLQQRHEKPGLFKSKLVSELGSETYTPGQPSGKRGFRQSLGNLFPSRKPESPFSSGGLPCASAHPMVQQPTLSKGQAHQAQTQRHPLSRTLTQSSSNSSIAEDSPTHVPIRHPGVRRPIVDFSKSLPVGGNKPKALESLSRDQSSQTSSNESSIATPNNYRLARPHPAAFASTGLISKRHKNVDDMQTSFQTSKSHMPDTPCKRHTLMGAPTPAAVPPENPSAKDRRIRHSFGTPSTPFSPHPSRTEPGTFGKGVSIFGSSILKAGAQRRGSFLSVEGENDSQSPVGKGDSQSSNDFDLPPTPTKQALTSSPFQSIHVSTSPAIAATRPTSRPYTEQACKFLSVRPPSRGVDEDSSNEMEASPSLVLRLGNSSTMPASFTRSRLSRNLKSPAPLNRASYTLPSLSSKKSATKRSPLFPASPVNDLFERLSPRTPRDHVVPPDPSGLSISAQGCGEGVQPMEGLTSSASMPPPATPTMLRDSFPGFRGSKSSTTPMHGFQPIEIDRNLLSRFDKVEVVGTGEFSQVYRCSKSQEPKTYFSMPARHTSPRTPLPDRVWAVKKSRKVFAGARDRERKLNEVNALRKLSPSDHTVEFFDSWEDSGHLYIQTEFCEEGTLDLFLIQEGTKGRLDDFRIWKIISELSSGLKHIHDSGFIHLDLKPANVLITFEGTLKIADFGMATPWPAQSDIEGEGDREYIGPEVLKGQFDKPADIFALGLIIFEIAGNVQLPDNGLSWQRLRNGDISDVPSLTFSSDDSTMPRDRSMSSAPDNLSFDDFYSSDSSSDFGDPVALRQSASQPKRPSAARYQREGELAKPPNFMIDSSDQEALDNMVRWMISPEPTARPAADQILSTKGVQWVAKRARAGATVYEGVWGPADEVLADDAEMIDV